MKEKVVEKLKGFKANFTKEEFKDIALRLFIVIVSSSIYALSVAWFLDPANLISLGFTGIGQILNRLIPVMPVGLWTIILNLPLCIIGFKYVSPKFIIYTLISVGIMAVLLMGWIPCPVSTAQGIAWLPVSAMENGHFVVDGVNCYIFGINPETEKLFLTIIGAICCGTGVGLALRFGVSSGGVDVLAQAVNLKDSKFSFGIVSMAMNICIAIVGGGIQLRMWNITFYTFIFIILCNVVVDKIHTAYTFQRLDIITTMPKEMSQALIEGIKRGCTISEVEGAYTSNKKFDCFMVVSSYEVDKAREIIHAIDPQAWVTVSPVKRIFGAFFKHTII